MNDVARVTFEQFAEEWRLKLLGLGLYGLHVETSKGPLERAQHALKLVPQVEEILRRIYSDLVIPKPVAPEAVRRHQPQTPPQNRLPANSSAQKT